MDSASTSTASNVPVVENDTETPMEIVKTVDESTGIVRMSFSDLDDENEEKLIWTAEEAQQYVLTKCGEYIRDPNHNPLLLLRNQATSLEEKIKLKNEEIMKLNRVFEVLYKDQVKFLRHIGVMPKVSTRSAGVHVDLAWLPDSVPGILSEDAFKAKTLNENLANQNRGNTANSIMYSKTLQKKKESTGPVECIDLTDDDPPDASASNSSVSAPASKSLSSSAKAQQHPAPLPPLNLTTNVSEVPPKPRLKLAAENKGIVLQWDLPPPTANITITGFEIFGYQEKINIPITSALWKKMGTVKPMALPMSCTLTHFVEKYKYHFAVRGVTTTSSGEEKYGFFSDPASIIFLPDKPKVTEGNKS